jgi:hypothetical protein
MPKGNRVHAFTIRMTPAELARLRRVARRAGTDASSVVRQLVKIADDERAMVAVPGEAS